MWHGLHMAWIRGCKDLLLKVDAKDVYNLLTAEQRPIGAFPNIGFSFKELINRVWNVLVTHIYREANQVANRLATMGLNLHCDYFEFPNPSGEIFHLLEDDKLGSSHPKVVSL